MKKKINSHPFRFLPGLLLLSMAVICFSGCSEQPGKTSDIPGYILPSDLRDTLPADVIGKIASLDKEMKKGVDPSFENVSPIFPKMKHPPSLAGVKEHMGKYFITWDGSILCPPLHVSFRVGSDTTAFGRVHEENITRSLLDGYLPVVTTAYLYDGITFEETVFGYSGEQRTENPQVAFIRMKVGNPSGEKKETKLMVSLREIKGTRDLPFEKSLLRKGNGIQNRDGKIIFWSNQDGGEFGNNSLLFRMELQPGETRDYFFSFPHLPVATDQTSILREPLFSEGIEEVRSFWNTILESGMEVQVPEDIVNLAYKTWFINNFILAEEDKSKNYYEVHDAFYYESVYGYAASMWLNTLTTGGYINEAKKCVDMFVKLQRPTGAFSGKMIPVIPHQNGGIIYSICQLYRMTGDGEWFRTVAPYVIKACDWIIDDCAKNKVLVDGQKTVSYGLLSDYRYCADEVGKSTDAREFLGNSWCWAGMEQAAIALGELGGEYAAESTRLKNAADEYKADIYASMEKAVIKENDLAFLPMVITNTTPFKTLQESKLSLYYNILSPRLLESEIFNRNDEKITWIPKFLEQRDGLVLGLARWRDRVAIDPHFIAGYGITNLRLNEIDKFLLTFYGLIAYGMSRETFSTQECSDIVNGINIYGNQGEKHWASTRQPHLHSSSELIRLVNMMLLKEEKEEIWLTWGTPRKWLEDGKMIGVKKMNTCFGPVDFNIDSHVSEGYIKTNIHASLKKSPSLIRLKLRHPDKKKIRKVEINGEQWKDFDSEVITIRPAGGEMTIVAFYN